MPRELIVNYAPYHRTPTKPQSFTDFCEMYETQGRITGLWCLQQQNAKTGEIIKEIWNRNVVTDVGAQSILQRAINSSSATPPNIFNNLLITNNSGSTTLNAALTANATGITSLTVTAVPAAIPSGTVLTLGYGSGNTQNVTTSGSTAQGATSITVTSFTVNATGFTVGAAVVPNPAVTDNPNNAGLTSNATTPLSSYSGNLATGAYTFNATTGTGNRNVIVTFTFQNASGSLTSVGNYTDCWITNVATGATTNNYAAHEINVPMRCDASNNIVATVTVRI